MVSLFVLSCLGFACTFGTVDNAFPTMKDCWNAAPLVAGVFAGQAYETLRSSEKEEFLIRCHSSGDADHAADVQFGSSERLIAWADADKRPSND